MNNTLSQVKKLLDERSWTLYKLSVESGIPYSSLNALFRKNNQPTLPTLEKICNGFKITLGEFFADCTPYRESFDRLEEDEIVLLREYRKLRSRDKENIISIINVFNESIKKAEPS